MDFKHLPFQCACNANETLSSYAKGNYDFYDVEQIEEFIAFKGAYEIASLLENIEIYGTPGNYTWSRRFN